MTPQPRDPSQPPADTGARIWQMYADEIGLPATVATPRDELSPPPVDAPLPQAPTAAPGRRRARVTRVRRRVAAVAAVVIAVVVVIALRPELRRLVDSLGQRPPMTTARSVEPADTRTVTQPSGSLRSDGRPNPVSPATPPPSVPEARSVASPPTSPQAERPRPSETAATGIRREPRLIHQITFDFGSDQLTEEAKRVLGKIVREMTANPEWRLTIEGHTDGVGSSEYNAALSERRAQAAKAHLEAAGISSQRLSTAAFGASRPLTSGKGSLTFLNRRVEFYRS